jgi:stage II sporulation protein D
MVRVKYNKSVTSKAVAFLFLLLISCHISFARADEGLRIRIFDNYSLQAIVVDGEKESFLINNSTFSPPIYMSVIKNSIVIPTKKGGKVFKTLTLKAPQEFVVRIGKGIRRHYLGSLQVSLSKGYLKVINITPLEPYVASVVEAETSDIKEPEALKATAIAVRSYVIAEKSRHHKEGFDMCDLAHCQLYKGLPRSKIIEDLTEATAGKVLTYKDRIIPGYFHACCGGQTENIERVWDVHAEPYYVSIDDRKNDSSPYYCQPSPVFKWTLQIKKASFEKIGRLHGWLKPNEKVVKLLPNKQTPTDRIVNLKIVTNKRTFLVAEKKLQQDFGHEIGWNKLKSAHFEVTECGKYKELFCFKGFGYGHGVGLCQSGAEGRARAGMDYDDILKAYYPHIRIQSLGKF